MHRRGSRLLVRHDVIDGGSDRLMKVEKGGRDQRRDENSTKRRRIEAHPRRSHDSFQSNSTTGTSQDSNASHASHTHRSTSSSSGGSSRSREVVHGFDGIDGDEKSFSFELQKSRRERGRVGKF